VDLVPVTQVATYPFALAVAASHPARDVPAFVAWVHGQRGGVNVGNAGAGSVPHFLGVKLAQVAKLDLEQVPYAGAPAMDAAVLSGELAAALGALSDLLPLHRAGRLRILAVTGPERSRAAPDVATFREAGYPELTAMGWHAIYAPRHTPGDAVDRWARAVRAALDSPALRARLVELGVEPTGTTPARLAEIQAADTAYWRPIVEASGFSAD
jgi:tripartite-type tricarboxylate transporter receptor subunit TctC